MDTRSHLLRPLSVLLQLLFLTGFITLPNAVVIPVVNELMAGCQSAAGAVGTNTTVYAICGNPNINSPAAVAIDTTTGTPTTLLNSLQCSKPLSISMQPSTLNLAIACGMGVYLINPITGSSSIAINTVKCSNPTAVYFSEVGGGTIYAACGSNGAVSYNVAAGSSSITSVTACAGTIAIHGSGVIVNGTETLIYACSTGVYSTRNGVATLLANKECPTVTSIFASRWNTNLIFLSCTETGVIAIVNGFVASTPFISPADCSSPASVTQSTSSGFVYAACSSSTVIRMMDSKPVAISTAAGCTYPKSVFSIDSNGLILTACATSNSIVALGSLAGIQVADGPGAYLPMDPYLSPPFRNDVYSYKLAFAPGTTVPSLFRFVLHYDAGSVIRVSAGSTSITAQSGLLSAALSYTVSTAGATTITFVADDANYVINVVIVSVMGINIVNPATNFTLMPSTYAPTFDYTKLNYVILPPVNQLFPTNITLSLPINFGIITASVDNCTAVIMTNNTVNFPLLAATALNHTLLITSPNGVYRVLIGNPCGFSGNVIGGSGSACPPSSTCLPTGVSSKLCTPVIVQHSLSFFNSTINSTLPTAYLTNATTNVGVNASLAYRLITPPIGDTWAAFDVLPGSLPLALFQTLASPFKSLDVLMNSPYNAQRNRECTDAYFIAMRPDNITMNMACKLPNNIVGANYAFSVQACAAIGCATYTGIDTVSTAFPYFVPLSLQRIAPYPAVVSPTGELPAKGMSETLSFDIRNILFDASTTYMFYGSLDAIYAALQLATNSTDFTSPDRIPLNFRSLLILQKYLIECSIDESYSVNAGVLTCTTPFYAIEGRFLRFIVVSGGQYAISSDEYSYPILPVIERVSGCPEDIGNTTNACPTSPASNLTITIYGSGFSTSDAIAQVGGINCPLVSVDSLGTIIECLLPIGSGANVAVVVQSYGLLSLLAPYLSYAEPTFSNIIATSCGSVTTTSTGIQVKDCPRSGANATLVIQGKNFGPAGATVFVGTSLCQLLASDEGVDPHGQVSCYLPAGKGQAQPIVLIQLNGKISSSIATVSYLQCDHGTYDPSPFDPNDLSCHPCPPGTFQSYTGATSCSSCPSGFYLSSTSTIARVEDCKPCLSGATCDGRMLLSGADHYLVKDDDGNVQTALCPTGYCTACSSDLSFGNASSTENVVEVYRSDEGSIFNSSSTATSIVTIQCCAAHRRADSILCGLCEDGYLDQSGQCCLADTNGGKISLFLFLSLFITFWLIRSSANSATGIITVFLYFSQTSMLELGGIKNQLLTWFNFVNFSPEFLLNSSGDNCVSRMNPYEQTLFNLLVPMILTAEMIIIAVLHRILYACTSDAPLQPPNDDGSVEVGNKFAVKIHQMIRAFRWSSYVDCFVAILLFCYTQVASTCFRTLWCVQVGHEKVVFSTPSMICGSSEYNQVLIPVILVLIFYVIGFPCAVLWLGWTLFRKRAVKPTPSIGGEVAPSSPTAGTKVVQKVHDGVTVTRRGCCARRPFRSIRWLPLFSMYREGDSWFWTSVILVRRSVFVVLDVTLASTPIYRSMSMVFANIFSMLLIQAVRPFKLEILNQAEIVSQLLLMFIAIIMTTQMPPFGDYIQGIFFLLVVPPVALLFAVLVYDRCTSTDPSHDDDELDEDGSPVSRKATIARTQEFNEVITSNPVVEMNELRVSNESSILPEHAVRSDNEVIDQVVDNTQL